MGVLINVVNSVPYWPVRPDYTVPIGNPVRLTPMFRIGKNTGRYLNTGPNHKKACFVNFDIFKGKIVILLNPNSKTLALPSSHTALFLSFFLSLSRSLSATLFSHSLGQSVSHSLSSSAALSLTRRRCSVSHSLFE